MQQIAAWFFMKKMLNLQQIAGLLVQVLIAVCYKFDALQAANNIHL